MFQVAQTITSFTVLERQRIKRQYEEKHHALEQEKLVDLNTNATKLERQTIEKVQLNFTKRSSRKAASHPFRSNKVVPIVERRDSSVMEIAGADSATYVLEKLGDTHGTINYAKSTFKREDG